MMRLLTGLLLAAALVGAATAAQADRVLAVEWQAGGGKLRWVSPTTLRPVGGAVLNVGGAPAEIVATSPDRAVAAIGGGANGRLRFVRLDGLRQEGLVWLGGGSILGGVWDSPSRLVVLVGHSPLEVVTVDPTVRKVVSRARVAGVATAAIRAGTRVLALLTPRNRIGAVRLAVVGADGAVRTSVIPGITGGAQRAATPGGISEFAAPGLAAEGDRAVVLGKERLVEVDLATLATRWQRLDARTTARALKRIDGWGRSVVWLRGSTIAYSGWSSNGGTVQHTGARTVDIASGATKVLDARAASVQRVGGTVLVYGNGPVRGFGLDGSLRYELLDGEDTGYVQVAGRYAYVGSRNSTRFAVVDVAGGRIVGRARTAKPTVVLAP